jgi:DnaJ-class molecular chaperone
MELSRKNSRRNSENWCTNTMKKTKTEMCVVCGGASFRASKNAKCDACFGQGYQTWQLVEPEKVKKIDDV